MADMLEDGAVGINRDHPVYNGGSNPHVVQGGIAGFVGDPGGSSAPQQKPGQPYAGGSRQSKQDFNQAQSSKGPDNGSVITPSVDKPAVFRDFVPTTSRAYKQMTPEEQRTPIGRNGYSQMDGPKFYRQGAGGDVVTAGHLSELDANYEAATAKPVGAPAPSVKVPANFTPADQWTNQDQFKAPDPYHDKKYVGPPTGTNNMAPNTLPERK